MKKLIDAVNLNVSLKKKNKEYLKCLQTVGIFLCSEKMQFRSEIQKLSLSLQTLPELNQEHEMQFCRNSVEDGIYCFKMKEKLHKSYENISLMHQILDFYRKMAKVPEKQLDILFPSAEADSSQIPNIYMLSRVSDCFLTLN